VTSPIALTQQKLCDSSADPFALWAKVYDEQPNPLLSLEEEFLSQLLPELRGLDVVDMGCGTGRWLRRLAFQRPGSLIGIDSSREMLARAAAKVGRDAVLLRADCGSATLSAGCADLCLASFVMSHVRDLDKFAGQLARILRPGGTAFITDIHPETAATLGWKRAFRYDDRSISIQTYERPIREVITALREHGFQVPAFLEPCFQVHQKQTLELHNPRPETSATQSPAIYILQVQLGDTLRASTSEAHAHSLQLSGARVGFGPRASAPAQLVFSDGLVGSIINKPLKSSSNVSAPSIDLSGYLLLPGLINSHDHLDFGLFPRLGRGGYRNAAEWAHDIQSREAAVIAQYRSVPKSVRCWWGAIRNLLCGVTTVCHHDPLSPELLEQRFPVRVLRNFEWAHSLEFDPDVQKKFCGTESKTPFIIHAAEGIDSASAEEVFELERRGLLNDRAVLIHALALTIESVSLLNRRGVAVVWCPASNKFLFGRTHDWRTISSVQNVVLGSDSSLTSTGDLLDDIAIARETGIAADRLYEMIYAAPARVFRMHRGEGTIRVGGVADLIAIRDTGADPADALSSLNASDIELAVLRGEVQLARKPVLNRLPYELCGGLEPLEVDGETIWLRAPVAQLFTALNEIEGPVKLGERRMRYAAGN
jgi:cytosine/adenosine deaminase-related metal-dependent hydrolase/ubiquinone/menaquinone biosynthesis C-methylase UbiE